MHSLNPTITEVQSITLSDICVMTKPPSLAKRREFNADNANRYRLLFSLWNTSTLSYISWQQAHTRDHNPVHTLTSSHPTPSTRS